MATQTANQFEAKVLSMDEGRAQLRESVSNGKFKATGTGASAMGMQKYLEPGDAPARAKFQFSGKFHCRTDKSDGSQSWYANGTYETEIQGRTVKGAIRATLGQVFQDGGFQPTDGEKLERLFSLLERARHEKVEAVIENRSNNDITWIPLILVFS